MNTFGFEERLGFSRGVREETDIATILSLLPHTVSCEKSDEDIDKSGVDYLATLDGGAVVKVDAKARDAGYRKYWKNNEPEMALEIWSVKPGSVKPVNGSSGKIGWALSTSSDVDLILFTYDPSDTKEAFLLPYQHLRIAFVTMASEWCKKYDVRPQKTKTATCEWQSECVFVPASVVLEQLSRSCRGEIVLSARQEQEQFRQGELDIFPEDARCTVCGNPTGNMEVICSNQCLFTALGKELHGDGNGGIGTEQV